MLVYDCGLGRDRLTHLSSLPPLQKHRQSMSRATSQIFLLHGSTFANAVTASDPTTGQVSRDSFSDTGIWMVANQCIALHENIIAFGTGAGIVSIVDVKNRRKVDHGWKPMNREHEFAVTALFIPPVAIEVAKKDTVVGGGTSSLISGSSAGEIILHDITTGDAVGTYKIPGSPTLPTYLIHYIDYDPATQMIIVGSCAGEIWTVKVSEQNDQLQKLEGTDYVDIVSWETQQDIIIDPETGLMSLAVNIFFLTDFANHSIFIIRDTTIHRHSLKAPHVMASFGSNETQGGKYTCASIDPEIQHPDRSRFFAVGDTEGTVSIYDARNVSCDHHPILALYIVIPVVPSNTPITALAINPLVLVTGSQDGTAKVYSTLDGNPLRTLCAPTSRRRRLRPPNPSTPELSNPIVAISLTTSPKAEVRGALGFESGYIRYWNFAPGGVGILLRSKKGRRNRDSTARDMRGFVESELERDEEEGKINAARRRQWERMNGGIQEEAVALQVAMMMSREHEERQSVLAAAGDLHEFPLESGADHMDASEDEDISDWTPGRKISFGNTSGSASPATRVVAGGILESVATFRRGKVPELSQRRSFEEDLEFAIRLSLAEQESRQENNSHE